MDTKRNRRRLLLIVSGFLFLGLCLFALPIPWWITYLQTGSWVRVEAEVTRNWQPIEPGQGRRGTEHGRGDGQRKSGQEQPTADAALKHNPLLSLTTAVQAGRRAHAAEVVVLFRSTSTASRRSLSTERKRSERSH